MVGAGLRPSSLVASAPSSTSRRDRAFLLVLALLLIIGVVAALTRSHGSTGRGPGVAPAAGGTSGNAGSAALAALRYRPGFDDEYAQRAAQGFSHPLYSRVPGGAVETAARVDRWRKLIEQAVDVGDAPVDANTLEALVYLESAGRADAASSGKAADAVGLTQIVGGTGNDLLGMRIDLPLSDALTRRIGKVRANVLRWKAKGARVPYAKGVKELRELRVARAKADPRYVPTAALNATIRYLQLAKSKLGREDLALTSYHMGIGNLQSVLSAYGRDSVSYVQLYFDIDPRRSPKAYSLMSKFQDDSATYYWRLLAAKQIMAQYRDNTKALAARAALATEKASMEDVLHVPADNPAFATPKDVADAIDAGTLERLPIAALNANGIAVSPAMGELAPRLKAPKSQYRSLRRGSLAMLVTMGAAVRSLSGKGTYLTATSTARDERYQRLLQAETVQATRAYSLHTSGWAVDISRTYRSGKQARMFQFVLTRMQALGLITWVREPEAIHVTAAADAESRLGPLLEVALGRS
jgi:hypothetical protein